LIAARNRQRGHLTPDPKPRARSRRRAHGTDRQRADAMRILVERGLFLESCRLAERVLPARTTDVSRAHVLVQAGGDTCTLHAAGARLALRLGVPAEVEQPGQALLPARQAPAHPPRAAAGGLRPESAPRPR